MTSSRPLGSDDEAVLDRIAQAETRRLIEKTDVMGDEYRFSHSLIREALYDTLPKSERRRLHKRVGETLAKLYESASDAPLRDLARHFFEAGFEDRAIRYSIDAAERSCRVFAFAAGAASYKMALDGLTSTPPVDQSSECGILLDLGDAQYRSGERQAGIESVKQSIEIARHIEAAELFARGVSTLSLWREDNIGIVPTERLSLLDEALEMLPSVDSPLRSQVLSGLSADLYWSEEFDRSQMLSREAVNVARRVDDDTTTYIALYQRYDLLLGPEFGDEVDTLNAECLALAKRLRDPEREFYARERIWERHVVKAEPTEIDQLQSDCEKLSEHLRQPRIATASRLMRNMRELWRGDLAACRQRLPEPAEAKLEGPSAIESIVLVPHMFLVLRMQGRLDELEPIVRMGSELFPRLFALRCALGLFCALTDRLNEAESILLDLARNDFAGLRRDANHAINLASLSETVARVRNRDLAFSLTEKLEPYAGTNMVAGAFMSLGSADRYLGLLRATLGDFDESAHHFENALSIETRMKALPWRALVERDYATMLIARNGGLVDAEANERLASAASIEATIRSLGPSSEPVD